MLANELDRAKAREEVQPAPFPVALKLPSRYDPLQSVAIRRRLGSLILCGIACRSLPLPPVALVSNNPPFCKRLRGFILLVAL